MEGLNRGLKTTASWRGVIGKNQWIGINKTVDSKRKQCSWHREGVRRVKPRGRMGDDGKSRKSTRHDMGSCPV